MTIKLLGIVHFRIRSYLYQKFLNPFVYSISKLDRLLLHNVVAGLFFGLNTKLPFPQATAFLPQALSLHHFFLEAQPGSHLSA